VWAVDTGKLVRSVKVRPGRVKALVVSAEGKTAVFASEADHLLHIWDLEKVRSLHRHAGHAHGLLTVAFSADGKEVVTAAQDWLRRWDADSGKEKRRIDRDLGGQVEHVVLSNDGTRAGVVLHDFKLRLWDAERGVELRRWDLPVDTELIRQGGSEERTRALAVHSFRFSPDGKTLMAAGDEVHRWDVASGKKLPSFRLRDANVLSLPDCVNHCERWLPVSMISYRVPAQLLLLDPATGKTGPSLSSPPLGVADLTASPDGRTVAALTQGQVRLLESASGQSRGAVADVHHGPGAVLAFSPDGRLLAVVAKEAREILLWDVVAGKVRATLRGHRGHVRSLAFSPDSRRLASGASDTVAYVWDVTGPAAAERLDEKVLDGLWSDLHSPESVRAFRAVCRLAGDPERSVPFLRQRLLYPPEEARRIARLIAGLDDQSFRVRQSSSQQLARLGARAGPALLSARKDRPTLEMARRIDELLKQLPPGDIPSLELLHERAIEALDRAGTPAARQVIKEAMGKRP
ncbi:MAG TPA: hypothetical protein VKD72_20125, partial [Gemmataceae bacterium]|nr:hypothetical protein [Gemmataceae bacterium]